MNEVQLVTYRVPAHAVYPPEQDLTALNMAINQPALVEKIGEGWTPVTHSLTLLPSSDEVLISLMLTRSAPVVPDSVPDTF